MIGKIAKVMAMKHAPKVAASIMHPRASARLAHTKYDLKHGYAPRITAVGAALLAVPVGFLIGQMMTKRGTRRLATQDGAGMTTPPM
jgi:hypothetical protein